MAIPEITRTGSELLVRFNSESDAKRIESALSIAFPQAEEAVEKPVAEPEPEAAGPEPAQTPVTISVHEKSKWNDGMVLEVRVPNTAEREREKAITLITQDVIDGLWGGSINAEGMAGYIITSGKPVPPGSAWDFTLKLKGSAHDYEFMGVNVTKEPAQEEPILPPEVGVEAAPMANTEPSVDAPGTLVYAPVIDPSEDVKRNLMQGAFGAVYEGGWGYKSAMEIVDDGDGPYLRTHMERGSHAGTKDMIRGAGFDTRTLNVEHAILEYKLRFKPGFDPVKGGKLPGLMGGDSPSGHKSADNGFTARMMWRSDAQGELYLYYPDMKQSHGDSIGRGEFMFYTTGEWQHIRQEVKLNDVGKTNGFIRVWFNNFLVIEANDLRLRTKDDVLIEGMMHTIFFGGSDDSWGASRDEWVDTGDFKIYVP